MIFLCLRQSFTKNVYLAIRISNSFISIDVSLVPPNQGWFKINTDGTAKGNLGFAGTGEAIRDYMD